MNKADDQDTAKRLSAIVADSLDTQARTQDLARQAYQSRTQFHRLFRTAIEETPGAMRRRLLLERAAYQLAHTGMPVTDIALDAKYGSLEAFTRAFRKSFRTSPSIYRRMRDPHFHLPAANKIHFLAPVPQQPLVPQQKEEWTWIYSIALQATIRGIRGVCWSTRVL
jgi:AraC family transcriptional regulator